MLRWVWLNDMVSKSPGSRIGSAASIDLDVDVGYVALNRRNAQYKLRRYLFASLSGGNEGQYFKLACREARGGRPSRQRHNGLPPGLESIRRGFVLLGSSGVEQFDNSRLLA